MLHLNYYPYWVEKQKKLFIILAKNITEADVLLKENFNVNPVTTVLKNLKFVFTDLRDNEVLHIRGLDKKGQPIRTNYPSEDNVEIISRGTEHFYFNITNLEDLLKAQKFNKYYDKVTVFAGEFPLTWGFTFDEANKKFSDIYCK